MPGPIPGVAAHLKILIVTDAWKPQVNGVVRTLEVLGEDLTALGHDVRYATPEGRFTIGASHLSRNPAGGVSARKAGKRNSRFRARRGAYRHRRHAGHERARHLPQAWHRILHLVPHPLSGICAGALSADAGGTGLSLAALVSRTRHRHDGGDRKPASAKWRRMAFTICASGRAGVDVDHFHPIPGAHLPYEGPIWLYVGRVAVEKNIEAFLALDLPGTKVVVGDGPARAAARSQISRGAFLGALSGEALVRAYAGSTFSSFPAAPTHSAWSCWRPWPAGFPWPPIRSRGPWTWWDGAPVAALDEDLGRPA